MTDAQLSGIVFLVFAGVFTFLAMHWHRKLGPGNPGVGLATLFAIVDTIMAILYLTGVVG